MNLVGSPSDARSRYSKEHNAAHVAAYYVVFVKYTCLILYIILQRMHVMRNTNISCNRCVL